MRLETGTSSASLKTPGLRGKSNMNSAFLPSFQGQDRHRHGRRPLLPSSATCHTVGDSTDSCPEFQSLNSPNSPHEPPTLNPPPALCTARIYLPTRSLAIISVHTPWFTNIAKFSNIQQFSSPPTFLLCRGWKVRHSLHWLPCSYILPRKDTHARFFFFGVGAQGGNVDHFKSLYWILLQYCFCSFLCFDLWSQSMWGLSSMIRDQTYTLCIRRWSLSHWTAMQDLKGRGEWQETAATG